MTDTAEQRSTTNATEPINQLSPTTHKSSSFHLWKRVNGGFVDLDFPKSSYQDFYEYDKNQIEPVNKSHFSKRDQTSIYNEASAANDNLRKSALEKNREKAHSPVKAKK